MFCNRQGFAFDWPFSNWFTIVSFQNGVSLSFYSYTYNIKYRYWAHEICVIWAREVYTDGKSLTNVDVAILRGRTLVSLFFFFASLICFLLLFCFSKKK